GLISAQEMDKSNLELVKAKSQLIRATTTLSLMEEKLKDTVVRSPMEGIILKKNVEEGQIISSGISSYTGGTLLAVVADINKVNIKADVDEVDIGKIRRGQKAKVVPDAFPDDVFYGQVIRVSPQAKIEQNVTTFEVTVEVENRYGKLKSGMNATVDITIADKKDVLLLPNEAIRDFRDLPGDQLMALRSEISSVSRKKDAELTGRKDRIVRGKIADMHKTRRERAQLKGKLDERRIKFVLVKDENGFSYRPIEAGISNFDFTEILSGLEEGDEVAVTYISRAILESQRFRERLKSMRSFGGIGKKKDSGK
ncbi:MAG: efflux RND transporter periplasmic adaptor subunit, partial [Fidelibacterota bacterium]